MGETETSEKTGQGQTGRKCWPFAITGERERERCFFYAQRPKRFMQKPLHERSYEDMSQTMEIDMVNFLKQYRDLMVKVKGVVVVVVILIVVVVVVVVVVRSLFRLYIVTSYEFNCNICRMS
jgi:hypothetical protein